VMLLGVRYEGRKSTFCGEYIRLLSCPSVTRTFVIPFVVSVLFESFSFQENQCYRFITSGLWKLQVTKFQLSYKSSFRSTLMAITLRHVLTISRIRSCAFLPNREVLMNLRAPHELLSSAW